MQTGEKQDNLARLPPQLHTLLTNHQEPSSAPFVVSGPSLSRGRGKTKQTFITFHNKHSKTSSRKGPGVKVLSLTKEQTLGVLSKQGMGSGEYALPEPLKNLVSTALSEDSTKEASGFQTTIKKILESQRGTEDFRKCVGSSVHSQI